MPVYWNRRSNSLRFASAAGSKFVVRELEHTAPTTEGYTASCASRVTHSIALPFGEYSHLCASAMKCVTPAASSARKSSLTWPSACAASARTVGTFRCLQTRAICATGMIAPGHDAMWSNVTIATRRPEAATPSHSSASRSARGAPPAPEGGELPPRNSTGRLSTSAPAASAACLSAFLTIPYAVLRWITTSPARSCAERMVAVAAAVQFSTSTTSRVSAFT